MDEDPREMDAPGSSAPRADAAAGRRRRWPGRVGVGLVVLLVAALVGLQIQAARVRDQAAQAEVLQRAAELDEEAAQIRLDSVGDRARVARGEEAAAQDRLAQSRKDMTDKGFEEPALHDIQVAKAAQVKDLRSQVKAVAAAIAEQKRLRPAADACVSDMLRKLGDRSLATTEACATVAKHSPNAG